MEDTIETMTAADAARELDGGEYREEGARELFARMKAAGLVAVFGASDDLAELRGAIDDETGAYDDEPIHLTRAGLLTSRCDCDDCPYFAEIQKTASTVQPKWDDGGFSWRYETAIPHEKFVVMEEGEPYCEGIVFALADVPA